MRCFKYFLVLIALFSLEVVAQERQSYTVGTGETLYSISKTLNVTVTELQAWNNLTDNNLSIGQELIYYTANPTEADTLDLDAGPSLVNISTPQENVFYIVKSGDTLSKIARDHNMSVTELKELNELNSDLISIGQRLSVRKLVNSVAPSASEFSEESEPQGSFAVYTVERGESMSSIMQKFRMTERELRELNPEVNVASIDRGQKITVLLPPSRDYENPYLAKANLQDLGEVTVNRYSPDDVGNTTTSGELYNPSELTAAHSNIALGSIIFIENPDTQQGIYVRINDRITGNGLKLSDLAFRILSLSNSSNPSVTIYTDS